MKNKRFKHVLQKTVCFNHRLKKKNCTLKKHTPKEFKCQKASRSDAGMEGMEFCINTQQILILSTIILPFPSTHINLTHSFQLNNV